jgi:hypothetical protein
MWRKKRSAVLKSTAIVISLITLPNGSVFNSLAVHAHTATRQMPPCCPASRQDITPEMAHLNMPTNCFVESHQMQLRFRDSEQKAAKLTRTVEQEPKEGKEFFRRPLFHSTVSLVLQLRSLSFS